MPTKLCKKWDLFLFWMSTFNFYLLFITRAFALEADFYSVFKCLQSLCVLFVKLELEHLVSFSRMKFSNSSFILVPLPWNLYHFFSVCSLWNRLCISVAVAQIPVGMMHNYTASCTISTCVTAEDIGLIIPCKQNRLHNLLGFFQLAVSDLLSHVWELSSPLFDAASRTLRVSVLKLESQNHLTNLLIPR